MCYIANKFTLLKYFIGKRNHMRIISEIRAMATRLNMQKQKTYLRHSITTAEALTKLPLYHFVGNSF